MTWRAAAGGTKGNLGWFILSQSDELIKRLGRHRWVHYEHNSRLGDEGHRCEILNWVKGELFVKARIDGMRANCSHQQAVSISCRFDHRSRANIAPCPTAIIDNDLLA
jgi:hypothetical protein